MAPYRGRFAPSPTGPLHAGSLVAALASWLDARAHGGRWLVRIEDVDTPRCVPGAAELILGQLARCGLLPDEAPLWQSTRGSAYTLALAALSAGGWAYPCGCTRSDIAQALAAMGRTRPRHAELVYPGTCRDGLHGKPARAMRVLGCARDGSELDIAWTDRRLGPQRQNLSRAIGDFILHRADGLWAYQLAVVVDDAEQHITHVVRGEDLADNTPRQIHLQTLLRLPRPAYLHTPLVRAPNGEKLSKQNGAEPLALADPLQALRRAGEQLELPGMDGSAKTVAEWLALAVAAWRLRWVEAAARD